MCITDRYFIICKIYISERLIVVLEYYRENLQKIAKTGKYSKYVSFIGSNNLEYFFLQFMTNTKRQYTCTMVTTNRRILFHTQLHR